MVAVHYYRILDVGSGSYVIPWFKATPAFIETSCAEIIPDTREDVALSALDERGRYVPHRHAASAAPPAEASNPQGH